MKSLVEIKEIIRNSKTVYIFGVNINEEPFIILHSKIKFNVDKPVEAFAKAEVLVPIAIISIKIRQYKKQANLRILIPPLDKQLRNLVNAIIKKKIILLSLMKIADFKELYLKVMEREAVSDREYDAVTFEIPVENAEALTSLITSMTFLDERKIKELTKVIEEKQDEEISKIRLGEPI